jgi:hypothetical protein
MCCRPSSGGRYDAGVGPFFAYKGSVMSKLLSVCVVGGAIVLGASITFSAVMRPRYALAALSTAGVIRMDVRTGAVELCEIKSTDTTGYKFTCYDEVGKEKLPRH